MFAYVARQAIYDRNKKVYAYELLFRDGLRNCFPEVSNEQATSNVLSSSHLSLGLEKITFNKPAFINFDETTLLHRFPFSMAGGEVVVEILETVQISDAVIKACSQLHEQGFTLALDDYDFSEQWDALIPFIRYVKIEVDHPALSTNIGQQKLKQLSDQGIKLIAEKVETHQDFSELIELGFDYFQGFFLAKPEIIKHKNVSVSVTSIVKLVKLSVSHKLDLDEVNRVFEQDLGLSYKLMRFINNPMVNKRMNITSLSHALKYLGEDELKKFIALLAISSVSADKPKDLVAMSLIRAQFCKLLTIQLNLDVDNSDLANQGDYDPHQSFLLGLFSMIDSLLDTPMDQVMLSLPLSDELKQALCSNEDNSLLYKQFQLCQAFEKADWTQVDLYCQAMGTTLEKGFAAHHSALEWANNMQQTTH